MTDQGYWPAGDDDDLPSGMGAVLDIGGPASVRRGGVIREPLSTVDSEPTAAEPEPPTVAEAVLVLAGAVDRLAAAVETRGRSR